MRFVLFLFCLAQVAAPFARADEPLMLRVRSGRSGGAVSADAGEPCVKPTAASDTPGKAVTDQNLDDLVQTTGSIEHFSMDDVYPLLGHCGDPDGGAQLAQRKLIPELKGVFKKPHLYLGRMKREADYTETMPKIRKSNGKIATESDWIAIDLLARTIYSEGGSNAKCGDEYPKAIGKLILNRMDEGATNPAIRGKFTGNNEEPNAHPILSIILNAKQFAVWRGHDAANKWAACPAKERQQNYKFRDKKGKSISTGQKANDMWQRSMEVASEIILREAQFRREFSSFKATQYTSGDDMAEARRKACWKPYRGSIGGKAINNRNCMEPWIEPTLAEQKACTGK